MCSKSILTSALHQKNKTKVGSSAITRQATEVVNAALDRDNSIQCEEEFWIPIMKAQDRFGGVGRSLFLVRPFLIYFLLVFTYSE